MDEQFKDLLRRSDHIAEYESRIGGIRENGRDPDVFGSVDDDHDLLRTATDWYVTYDRLHSHVSHLQRGLSIQQQWLSLDVMNHAKVENMDDLKQKFVDLQRARRELGNHMETKRTDPSSTLACALITFRMSHAKP
jgi:hypothetical protein